MNFTCWVFMLNDQRWEYVRGLCILPLPHLTTKGAVITIIMAPGITPPCGHTFVPCDVAASPIKCRDLFFCLLEFEIVSGLPLTNSRGQKTYWVIFSRGLLASTHTLRTPRSSSMRNSSVASWGLSVQMVDEGPHRQHQWPQSNHQMTILE